MWISRPANGPLDDRVLKLLSFRRLSLSFSLDYLRAGKIFRFKWNRVRTIKLRKKNFSRSFSCSSPVVFGDFLKQSSAAFNRSIKISYNIKSALFFFAARQAISLAFETNFSRVDGSIQTPSLSVLCKKNISALWENLRLHHPRSSLCFVWDFFHLRLWMILVFSSTTKSSHVCNYEGHWSLSSSMWMRNSWMETSSLW